MKVDPVKTQKEALFEAVLDNVTDAIIVIDKDLKVIFQNEAVHRMYGSKQYHYGDTAGLYARQWR